MVLDKNFSPKEVESKQYKNWLLNGAFKTGDNLDLSPYTIMMPPPNVTGRLHMGHALTFTLQDVLIRFHRMLGKDVLWQAGTDHAGIATQMVVERQLQEKKLSRKQLGREEFLRHVWEWKDKSGGMILEQLKRLGASADWSRERFTMDSGLSEAVTKVLVNWDPKLQTAVSDLEVLNKEAKGKLYYIRYYYSEHEDKYIVVATTRPETLFGDVAVAVHPDDPRYKDSIGLQVQLPLTTRKIKIIADSYSNMEKGSGAVKITPAHDFNDFDVGVRHRLESINIFDENGKLNNLAPTKFQGLSREMAREAVVKELQDLHLIEKIEDHVSVLPIGDRSGAVIEPRLTDQWYVDTKKLVQPAIDAVKQEKIVFVPKHWEKVYFDWLENIQPWCISRQLWWGHQIPVWYGPDKHSFVAESEEEAKQLATKHYKQEVKLHRDDDVLDTWFSSALWPFSTLGWPNKTADLKRYYPTDVLITGFDIIFFWVARMVMMGIYFMKEVPFKKVYINALVRDQFGQKMSKTKGNIIDPIELIEQYGTDALRFTLATQAVPGQDIKLSQNRVESHRNFVTKIWNAARFCLMNDCVFDPKFNPYTLKSPVNQWIVNELIEVTEQSTEAYNDFRFHEVAQLTYQFTWSRFCDWYLEMAKPLFSEGVQSINQETKKTAAWVFQHILKLLHPLMPFITEELWPHFSNSAQKMLINASWPNFNKFVKNDQEHDINFVIDLISQIRSIRSEMNIPVQVAPSIQLLITDNDFWGKLQTHIPMIKRLAKLDKIQRITDAPRQPKNIQMLVGKVSVFIEVQDIIDVKAEKIRLGKEIDKNIEEFKRIQEKLSNKQFMAKAEDHVVAEFKERLVQAEERRQKLHHAMQRIENIS